MNNKTVKLLGIILLLLVFTALILTPMRKKTYVKKVLVKKATAIRGRIAIVIDDWGYHLDNLALIEKIKQPLTCAVLPNLKNSSQVMRKLNNLGCEIILHLPMEPKEKFPLEKNTIKANMNAEQIRAIFEKDLSSVAFAKGVSNHMGSRITEDMKISQLVIIEAKKRKLYFFDSFVTNKSVVGELSKKAGIKTAKRDIFLDNQQDFEYIKSQLLKLKELSRKQGLAIGIGHDRKNTLLVLKNLLPQLEKEGYKFVFLSQVVK